MNKSYPKKEKQKVEESFSPSKQNVRTSQIAQLASGVAQANESGRDRRSKIYPSSSQCPNIPPPTTGGAFSGMPNTYNVS